MPKTFAELLAELIKRAKSPDDPIRAEFHDGDIAHLQRWLESGEANEIWASVSSNEPFNSGDAFKFVRFILSRRREAEEADQLNEQIPILARRNRRLIPKARRRVLKRKASGEITADQYRMFEERVGEMPLRLAKVSDPLFSNRSSRRETGSRQRTIFCRVLSESLHGFIGKKCYAEVAMLCQMAFDCDDVTIDMVRSACRESTRTRKHR